MRISDWSSDVCSSDLYAMPGMETKLHGVFNQTGQYTGFSANYSGWGFSDMRFAVKSLSDADFAKWVAATKAGGGTLDRMAYLKLEKPSEHVPPQRLAEIGRAPCRDRACPSG